MQHVCVGDHVRVFQYKCYGYYKTIHSDTGEERWRACDREEESVRQWCSMCGQFKNDATGVVVYSNKYYFTVQQKCFIETDFGIDKYLMSQCFLKVDIENGDYILQKRKVVNF